MSEIIVNEHTLHLALNFKFHTATKFELYRRKDNRHFRFIHYDGKNYDELYSYLQNEKCNVNIPEKEKLLPGRLFNVNGQNKFVNIPTHVMDFVIAANNYIVRNGKYYNLLFNYDIARYLLSTYNGIILKTSVEVNSGKSVRYTSLIDLECIPQNSCIRTHRVWFISSRTGVINQSKIPKTIIDSYLQSEDYYQEFEIFEKEGKKGIIAWRTKVIIPPLYSNILIENYRAYLQNEKGYWAEYSLKNQKQKSEFIYSDIQIDAEKGYAIARENDQTIILHSQIVKDDVFILKDENGLYGVKKRTEWKIPAEYDYISLWKGSDKFEVFKDGKYGLFDNAGKCLLSCVYEFIDAPTPDMILFKASRNGKWGIVGYDDRIYHDFTIEDNSKQLEEEYTNASDQLINFYYQHHEFLPLQLLTRNFEKKFILMKITVCNRCFKIYRNHLPSSIFNSCMASYLKAIKTLKNLAIRVEKDHKIIIDYNKTLDWLNCRNKMHTLKPLDIVNGIIHSIGSDRIVVKLENGIHGIIPKTEMSDYNIGEQLCLVVKEIKQNTVVLKKV